MPQPNFPLSNNDFEEQSRSTHPQAQKVLHLAQNSPVALGLSKRIARLGLRERVIIDHQKTQKQTKDQDIFLGDWNDPMTLLLALQDVQGVFVDLSSLSRSLYTTDSSKRGLSQDQKQESQEAKANKLWEWQGIQRSLSKGVKELLGTYKAPTPSPQKHSSWDNKNRDNKNRDNQQKSSEQKASLDQAVLSYALKNSSLPFDHFSNPSTNHNETEREKPLTFLVPSVSFDQNIASFLSDENLASYQLAGWRPNVIFYDWVLGKLGSEFGSEQDNTKLVNPSVPGVLTSTLAGIFACVATLKLKKNDQFTALLEGKSRLSRFSQPLSLVDLDDLVSVAMIVHQTRVSGERYLLKGDRLTWFSLIQICAHLVDPLSAQELHHLAQMNALQLDRTWKLTHFLKTLSKNSSPLKKTFGSVALSELSQVVEKLIHSSKGGALAHGHGVEFSPLPHHFACSPITNVLSDKLDQFLLVR